MGLSVLGGAVFIVMLFIWSMFPQGAVVERVSSKDASPFFAQKDLVLSLDGPDAPCPFPLPRIEPELTFSSVHSRPGATNEPRVILSVGCKRSARSKKISLPSRLDLCYLKGDFLDFSETESLLWAELSEALSGKVQATVWADLPSQGKVEVERFVVAPQAIPIQAPHEFAEGSPFRVLAEARWLGQDVFSEKYDKMLPIYRIGMGDLQNGGGLAVGMNQWLVWENDQWVKSELPDDQRLPIARIVSADQKALVFEGWNLENYVRIALPLTPNAPLKVRGDEMFHSIRIRSERQISCMLEKQCLILRCGDWILKTDGRWKILKKAEEREAYQAGKLAGELFVFEKIDARQGQKWIQGTLFNAEKTQMAVIDMQVNQHVARSGKRRAQ